MCKLLGRYSYKLIKDLKTKYMLFLEQLKNLKYTVYLGIIFFYKYIMKLNIKTKYKDFSEKSNI